MRVNGAVLGRVERAVDVVHVHERVELLGVLGPQHVAVHPHHLADGVQPLVLLEPLLVVGYEQPAVVDPSWLNACLRFERGEDLNKHINNHHFIDRRRS